jgi:hypothetical protein
MPRACSLANRIIESTDRRREEVFATARQNERRDSEIAVSILDVNAGDDAGCAICSLSDDRVETRGSDVLVEDEAEKQKSERS